MFKKAKHWLLILLVCVLFVGFIPGKASAASATPAGFVSYNGVNLPPIKQQWKDTYDYMLISVDNQFYGTIYNLYMTNVVEQRFQHSDGLGVLFAGYSIASYYSGATDWSDLRDWSDSNIVFLTEPLSPRLVWSDFNMLDSAGVAFPATVPGQPAGAYTPPTIIVNLPRNHVYTYELNEEPQQLYVDAVISQNDTTGTGVHYQWVYYNGSNWLPVDYGNGNGKYYTPNTGVEGTRQYACIVSNEQDIGGVSSVRSNAVYVVVGTSSNITEPITPADQVIIDQVGQIGDKIDELPEQITDGVGEVIEQQKEQEKMEAAEGGQESVNDLLEIIPDVSEAGQSAFAPLVDACRYDGYEAVLPIPALVLPAIGEHVPQYTLLAAQELDLGAMISLIPEHLILIVRLILTFALCFFLLKDIYGVIMYFFTLKGDGE